MFTQKYSLPLSQLKNTMKGKMRVEVAYWLLNAAVQITLSPEQGIALPNHDKGQKL